MAATVYLNNRFLPAAEARVSVFDAGMLYGAGVFETLLARRGVPFYYPRHFARLRGSCAELGIRLPVGQTALHNIILEVLRRNELNAVEARVKVLVTPGDTAAHISHRDTTLLVSAEPYLRPGSRIPWKLRMDGRVVAAPTAVLKSTSYLAYRLALHEARANGYDDAILLDRHGNVSETSIASLLLFREGSLLLPQSPDALHGITRRVLAEIAAERGLRIEERPVSPEDLSEGHAVCVCNALLGPFPVARINDDAVTPMDGDLLAALREDWESRAAEGG